MNNFKFFIDTADVDYISNLWDNELSKIFDSKALAGITTNPSSMSKSGVTNLSEFEERVDSLAKLVTSIRSGNYSNYVPTIFVQVPNSHMKNDEMFRWAEYVKSMGNDHTSVSLKIPPYVKVLEGAYYLNEVARIRLNVTGVADAATALRCFRFDGIHNVSLIPGRMEEVGIDGTQHVQYVTQSNIASDRIIAGSMRTIKQLKDIIQLGACPTIGAKVWDLFYNGDVSWERLQGFKIINKLDQSHDDKPPKITEACDALSKEFFVSMDKLAEPLCKEFVGG